LKLTNELISEIVDEHIKCNQRILAASGSGVDQDYLSARIEDEIYFKYQIEFEEVAAYYLHLGKAF
jgi:hypothetical protein